MGVLRELNDRPLSARRASERAKTLLATGEVVPPRKHLRDRKSERRITTVEIERIIETGTVTDIVWKDYEWRYKFSGILTDGERMACVVTLGQRLSVITVMWERPIAR
jgi:hypothetical protein